MDPQFIPRHYDNCMRKEIAKHRFIHLSTKDSLLFFLHYHLGFRLCPRVCKKWSKGDKFQKLYDISKEKLQNNLNIFKFIRTLRLLKVVMRNTVFTKNIEYDCVHSNKCIINLDNSSEDSSENCSHDGSPSHSHSQSHDE